MVSVQLVGTGKEKRRLLILSFPTTEHSRMHEELMARIEQRLATYDEPSAAPPRSLAGLERRTDGLPDWWSEGGNVLLASASATLPAIVAHPGVSPPRSALIVLQAASVLQTLILWGSDAIVALGAGASLRNGTIGCGGPAVVLVGDNISAGNPEIQARNGGLIHIGGDGLWSSGVRVFSDDMHAVRDVLTGKRLNAFGGRVLVGEHVWLGYEVLLLAGARIGHGSVIGARSVVKAHIPPHASCAGNPARVSRTGVEWRLEDAP